MTADSGCQPLDQFSTTIIDLVAAAIQRNGIPADTTISNYTGECLKTIDSIWRWIIDVRVIPAAIALWFRLAIIEPPRYTAYVGRDSKRVIPKLDRYLVSKIVSAYASTISVDVHPP